MNNRFHYCWLAAIVLFTLSLGLSTNSATLVVETKPNFSDAYGRLLEFKKKGTKDAILCVWPPRMSKTSLTLETNSVYKISIFDGGEFRQEILKVEQGGRVIFDGSVCEVHSAKMKYKRVQIVYGLLMPITYGLSLREMEELENSRFPHHQEFLGGGCVVMSGNPKHGHLWVCESCKTAFKEWEEAKKTAGK